MPVEQIHTWPGEDPLEWFLLSTAGGLSKRLVKRIVGWYETPWLIEEVLKVLQSGARIQDRRLRTAAALGKCLAFENVEARFRLSQTAAIRRNFVLLT